MFRTEGTSRHNRCVFLELHAVAFSKAMTSSLLQMCPHRRAFVLDHGIIGDDPKSGSLYVSCARLISGAILLVVAADTPTR